LPALTRPFKALFLIAASVINEMSVTAKDPETSREFVKQSSLYQEFLAEREEILRHKWLESERLGYDIGFERALLDWIRKHREAWRSARRAQISAGPQHTHHPFNDQRSRQTTQHLRVS
jgi:hypothetical protein